MIDNGEAAVIVIAGFLTLAGSCATLQPDPDLTGMLEQLLNVPCDEERQINVDENGECNDEPTNTD